MRIYKATDYNDMSRKAANIISAQIIMKPDCVLGLATGSSPVGTYKQLIEWYNKNDLDFSEVTSINLDEYKGLSPEDPQSYRYFMNTHLFDHVNIDKNTYIVKSEYVEELAEVHLINSRLDISIEDILVALKQINIGRLIIHRHLTYKEKELLETQLEVFPEKINEKIIGNLDEEEILFDINIPIVLVTGISEYTNKFDVQIDLYSRFKKEGYSVGWIGSRKEAVLCGGESIPEWLYGTQLSFKDKIVYFNHYVKEYIEKNKNEVLIIGIPGEVCINDNYFIGHAGELATIISQAVNASATIVCMMFDENIEKKTKIWGNYIEGKLGVQIKCFAITNRLYDYNESDVVRKIKYTTLNNQTIQKMAKIFDGVYMISLDEEKDRLFDALIAELSEEENEL